MRTHRHVRLTPILCAGLLTSLMAGCGTATNTPAERTGSHDTSETMTHSSTPAVGATSMSHEPSISGSSQPMMHGTEIAGGNSKFGTVLFDGTGQAIYVFDVEKTATPACYDDCAAAWPPVLTDGEPQAGTGAQAALLGTTTRKDGTTQVTYDSHPLYYYAHEGKHEVKCHNVDMNGGKWYAVQLDGMHAPAS
jgi:predicted lipoprotein with Yx(FWY)xxD motif